MTMRPPAIHFTHGGCSCSYKRGLWRRDAVMGSSMIGHRLTQMLGINKGMHLSRAKVSRFFLSLFLRISTTSLFYYIQPYLMLHKNIGKPLDTRPIRTRERHRNIRLRESPRFDFVDVSPGLSINSSLSESIILFTALDKSSITLHLI